ncbi:MAG: winged helix DNA-binding protein [Alphaproteobacteria bacterium]|nr:winged helix DNA-binding protein [Alphaproteobacteria bacterium]
MSDEAQQAKKSYLDAIKLIERLHRQFLEVVKTELDRNGIEDINNVQALILFNIDKDELTVGELTNRGYYLGSNVSYNVRKMVENGYLIQERSPHDKRSIRVRLSEKGLQLCSRVDEMFRRHATELSEAGAPPADIDDASETYKTLERYWAGILDYRLRAAISGAL